MTAFVWAFLIFGAFVLYEVTALLLVATYRRGCVDGVHHARQTRRRVRRVREHGAALERVRAYFGHN